MQLCFFLLGSAMLIYSIRAYGLYKKGSMMVQIMGMALFPLGNMALYGSIYITLAVSFERFLGGSQCIKCRHLCFTPWSDDPIDIFSSMNHSKNVLFRRGLSHPVTNAASEKSMGLPDSSPTSGCRFQYSKSSRIQRPIRPSKFSWEIRLSMFKVSYLKMAKFTKIEVCTEIQRIYF